MSDLVKRLQSYAKNQGGWHNIDDTCEEAAARIEELEAALRIISRMKVSFDDTINRITLAAAISIGEKAITENAALASGEGKAPEHAVPVTQEGSSNG